MCDLHAARILKSVERTRLSISGKLVYRKINRPLPLLLKSVLCKRISSVVLERVSEI